MTQTKIETTTLASAMAAAFGEIESATKTAKGQVGRQEYKYADLTGVIEAIKPALIAHGLFFTQRPQPSEGGVTIETVLGHTGGEEMSLGVLFVPANKHDAQGFGSALTYARRYALVTAFGVPVEDDDGNAASRQNQAGAGSSPEYTDDPVDFISDEQAEWIINMLEQNNIPVARLLKAANVRTVTSLPAAEYEQARNWINNAIAERSAA